MHFVLIAWLIGWLLPLRGNLAAEPVAPAAESVRFCLAVPGFESRISVGVYAQDGRLIRKIAERVPEGSLEVGLNGFQLKWDGRDEGGREVEPGVYTIRGAAVAVELQPDFVQVEGNDWRGEFGDELPVARVVSLAPAGAERIAVLAELKNDTKVVFVYDVAAGELIWSRFLHDAFPGRWVLGRPAGRWVCVAQGEELMVFSPADGRELMRGQLPRSWASPVSVLVENELVRVCGSWGVGSLSLMGLIELQQEREFFQPVLFAFGNRRYLGLVDEKRRLWIKKSGEEIFREVYEGWRWEDASASGEGSFWAIGIEPEANRSVVGEFSWEGEFLRELVEEFRGGVPREICVNSDNKVVFLLMQGVGGSSEVVGFRQREDGVKWERFFRRRIEQPSSELPEGYEFLPKELRFESGGWIGGGEGVGWRLVRRIIGEVALELPGGLRVAEWFLAGSADAVQAKLDSEGDLWLRVLEPGAAVHWCLRGFRNGVAYLDGGEVRWPPEERMELVPEE